eukprot:scaffold66489_cov34-Tisochrysis_lutea.AAC.2
MACGFGGRRVSLGRLRVFRVTSRPRVSRVAGTGWVCGAPCVSILLVIRFRGGAWLLGLAADALMLHVHVTRGGLMVGGLSDRP